MKVRVYPKCIRKCECIRKKCEQINDLNSCIDSANAALVDLADILEKDDVISMREHNGVIEIVGFQNHDMACTYLYQLGSRSSFQHSRSCSLGKMTLGNAGNGTIVLEDWSVTYENDGLGTYFLSSVLQYLKSRGFWLVQGSICPTDYGHLEKLEYFYRKMGFDITDGQNEKRIKCQLLNPSEREMGRHKKAQITMFVRTIEAMSQTSLAEQLGITEGQFQYICNNVLFQNELLGAAKEIAHKYIRLVKTVKTE